VAKLDRRDAAVLAEEGGDPGEAGDLGVVPQPDVPGADPPLRRHPGRLDHDQPEAAEGETPQVDEVVVAHDAVGDVVLAHRRDDQPVGERDPAQGQRLQQDGLGGGRLGHAGINPAAGVRHPGATQVTLWVDVLYE
jgi:hypothetical protein